MSVAVSNFDRDSAKSFILQCFCYIQSFQLLNRWYINHIIRNRCMFHFFEKSTEVIPFKHLSIFTEGSICYILNFHFKNLLIFCRYYVFLTVLRIYQNKGYFSPVFLSNL